ncbi:MAG: GHKL domain-containing protein [Clostridiales bacterium]|nr:GHKL domain-containing protein [Clostridiales bacterium]
MNMALTRYVIQFAVIFALLIRHRRSGKQKWWRWILAGLVGLGCGLFIDLADMMTPILFYPLTGYLLLAYWWVTGLPFLEYLFYFSAGMLIQDAVFNLFLIFYYAFGLTDDMWQSTAIYLAVFVLLYTVIFRLFTWWRNREGEPRIQTNVTVLSILIFLINQISQLFIVIDENYDWHNVELRLYSILVCALALSVQFGLFHSNRLQRENETIRLLLQNEQKQHALQAENVALINRKCHDLKQQIAAIRQMTRAPEQEQELARVEEAISFYDSILKTGNDALDAILGEKRMVCEKEQIRLNYMGDGSALDFLQAVDVYTLLGNALDNAIESVRSEEDVEKRFVLIEIRQTAGMAVIHMENYCGRPLQFVDGLPETTKGDRRYHGYGMKSIRYLVNQYGGTLSVDQKDCRFVMNVAIPFPTGQMQKES